MNSMKLITVPVFFFILYSSLPSTISSVEEPDFLYLTLQWPVSKCNSEEGCCYDGKAKRARDFVISRVEPYYFNGTSPKYCSSPSRFNLTKMNDLVPRLGSYWPSLDCPATESEKIWSREWKEYGTCSTLDQHLYFAAGLKLQKKAKLLQVLENGGIYPNGASYDIGNLSDTIINAGMFMPGLVCNKDKQGSFQLNKVIFCSNYNGSRFSDCPGNPVGSCSETVKFPSF